MIQMFTLLIQLMMVRLANFWSLIYKNHNWYSSDPSSSRDDDDYDGDDLFGIHDIGRLLHNNFNLHSTSRDHKYLILMSETDPNPMVYPRSKQPGSKTFRQFQPEWLRQYPWLHYSKFADGVFCRACALFAPPMIGGQSRGQFVKKPFNSWANRSQKMHTHAKLEYHVTAMVQMSEFLARHRNPSKAVHTKLNMEARKILETNQKVIESLLKIVMLCGRQGLALRGHRDDAIIWEDESASHGNQGNFAELDRFRAETDEILRNHLHNAPKNAKYTSKTIQNELITVIGDQIRSDIMEEACKAKFFSIIADEVTDTSNKEQLSFSIRFVSDDIKEVFIDFLAVERITGEVLAEQILKYINSSCLSLSDLRGQCYDGGSNMSGARKGCRAIIQEQAPMATFVHCHRLNLAVVSSCKIHISK